jgi:hypothetical protein
MDNNILDELFTRIKTLEARNSQLKEQLAKSKSKLANPIEVGVNNVDGEVEGKNSINH